MSCILCGTRAVVNQQGGAGRCIYNCSLCGMYVVSDTVKDLVKTNASDLAAFMMRRKLMDINDVIFFSFEDNRESSYINITVKQALQQLPKSFSDRLNASLQNLAHKSGRYGNEIIIDKIEQAPMLYSDRSDISSISYMLMALEEMGWIRQNVYSKKEISYGIMLTVAGWNQVDSIENGEVAENVLIFAPSLKDDNAFISAVQKMCRSCGYSVIIHHYSEEAEAISASLIASVKAAKIVICELSIQSSEVYYVAGLAQGLGKSVIRLCRNDAAQMLPIETQQLSVLLWESVNEAARKIKYAIQILP